jgi:hypothetical protein
MPPTNQPLSHAPTFGKHDRLAAYLVYTNGSTAPMESSQISSGATPHTHAVVTLYRAPLQNEHHARTHAGTHTREHNYQQVSTCLVAAQ